jgi:hypothetical protein
MDTYLRGDIVISNVSKSVLEITQIFCKKLGVKTKIGNRKWYSMALICIFGD